MIKPVSRSTLVGTLRQQVLQEIVDQYQQKNLKLPPEQEMALQLNVARNTLRQVLCQLESEGFIIRKHGKGTFINPEALQINVNLQELIDFSDIVRKCGHVPSNTIHSLKEVEADAKLAALLEVPQGHRLLQVEYWIYADGAPAIVAVGWCARDIFSTALDISAWEKDSYFQVLQERAGRMVKSDRLKFSTLTVQQANMLLGHETCLSCDSVLVIDSVAFDQQGTPMIFGKALFDTTLIQFDLFRTIKE